jgi:hypothetical protein
MDEEKEDCFYYDVSDDRYGFVRNMDDDEKNSLTDCDDYSIFDV